MKVSLSLLQGYLSFSSSRGVEGKVMMLKDELPPLEGLKENVKNVLFCPYFGLQLVIQNLSQQDSVAYVSTRYLPATFRRNPRKKRYFPKALPAHQPTILN